MVNRKEYKTINCSYYDVLEAHATNGDLVEIAVKTEIGEIQIYSDSIINLKSRKGEEFAIMASGNVFRLDDIMSINGESPKQPLYNSTCWK